MTIVVETGAIVSNANSYVTVAETRAYATARGVSLSATDTDVEILLIKAMDYLESKRSFFQGSKVSALQALQWPRSGVVIDELDVLETTIPNELKQAQIRLAVEISNGVDVMPTRSSAFVKKEKTDVIETEYSEKIGTGIQPEMTAVEALLSPLFTATNSSLSLSTVRV